MLFNKISNKNYLERKYTITAYQGCLDSDRDQGDFLEGLTHQGGGGRCVGK